MAGSRIPSAETLIIAVFFLGVALWAVNKCTHKRTEIVAQVHEFATRDEDDLDRPPQQTPKKEVVPLQPATRPAAPPVETIAPVSKPSPAPGRQPSRTPATEAATPPTAAPSNTTRGTVLYVVIDGLKMRKTPGLNGALVTRLKLHDQVTFLQQKTDWTQEISLGTEKVTDHWVRVRNEAGQEGWVFGAGVHYYKMKRKGVTE